MGPMTMPSEKTLDQTAIALGRSTSVKMSATMESVDGLASAAPSPMKARSAMSCVASPTNGVMAEPTPKTVRPITSRRRRP